MTTQQLDAFAVLQQCWARHQDLRDANAPLATLVESRQALDEARLAVARIHRTAA